MSPPFGEFDLIARLTPQPVRRNDVVRGIGDDGAVLCVPAGTELVASLDTLVEGVHFLPGTDPEALGHKALAVNLSDLAAMGVEPAWAMLALTLPQADESWLTRFSQGFFALAKAYQVQLIGGDTTRGPLSLTVQVMGFVPQGRALRRDGASAGDALYVTGTLGDAGLALAGLQGQRHLSAGLLAQLRDRLERPEPRVAIGQALRRMASAAIDLSDGLVADLGHVLRQSGVGAIVELTRLPLSTAVRAVFAEAIDWTIPLSAGDDYELLFTAPASAQKELAQLGRQLNCPIIGIGEIQAGQGLTLTLEGEPFTGPVAGGFEHFQA